MRTGLGDEDIIDSMSQRTFHVTLRVPWQIHRGRLNPNDQNDGQDGWTIEKDKGMVEIEDGA